MLVVCAFYEELLTPASKLYTETTSAATDRYELLHGNIEDNIYKKQTMYLIRSQLT